MSVLLLSALLSTALAEPVEGLQWKLEGAPTRTWVVENEVVPPMAMWFLAERNVDVRVIAFQTRVVLTCPTPEKAGGKSFRMSCAITDVALSAAKLVSDGGDLQKLLDEVDENLTGAVLQITLREDGRVIGIDLDEYTAARNRRTTRMQDNLNIVLNRAAAGFDLQLPPKGYSQAGAWAQFESQILRAPTTAGSQGSAEVAHKVQERQGRLVAIDTMGRGILAAASDGPQNLYDARVQGVSVFDLEAGVLVDRVWTAIGDPTASSTVSEAGEGVPYAQRGHLRLVPEGEAPPPLGETKEVAPPGRDTAGLSRWTPLGLPGSSP